ncbi:MAG: hypothetical protein FJ194_05390 [Gammaproteobacteria bacterium]|nr:hypothetical protein [Gammaproteobacteria bacterium]
MDAKRRIAKITFKLLRWAEKTLPPGVRAFVGLLFTIGGIVGFLPILGFWMLPLGLAIIALDIPPLRRRIHSWMVRLHATAYPGREPYQPTSSQ